jgi:signal transduction histidine kinase
MDNSQFSILVVDDIKENLTVLGSILKQSGYRIALADNGAVAIDFARKREPDLILLDVMMPDMDGYETCQIIKKNPKIANIPIIFITARSDMESTVKGFDLGAVDYIVKPFNRKELLARVQTHLSLKKAQDDLKRVNSTKDKFFSIIAHDLKGPIGTMDQLLDLMIRDIFSEEEKKNVIGQLSNSAKSTYELLENLLYWARGQDGSLSIKQSHFNLKECIESVINLFQTKLISKKVELKSSLEDISFEGDKNMISTAIRNIVSNALKFSPQDSRVDLTLSFNENSIFIVIKDYGVGISEECLSKIFDVDSITTTRGTDNEKGSGLGLKISKEFIEKNGGSLTVESEIGKGTEVKIELPAEKR